MVTRKRDSKRPKSRGKNISRRPEKIGYCPEEGFDYKAVGLLKKYVSETGKIDSAKRNGLSSKCQRSLTAAIKRARHMALLPFASNHNYDTSLLDIGKRNSEEVVKEEVDTNSTIPEEKNAPSSEVNSDEVADNGSVDEVSSDDPIAENSEAEDKEESS
tara:strand:+ start:994 stop:1470 length:477 start_codon:yes stop_codon:yes gene_type:complete